jgi:putative membrane protein
MQTKIIIALVLVVIALVIALQNTEIVPIRMLFWEFGMPRIVMILLSLLVGIVIGYIIALSRRGRREYQKKGLPPSGADTV